jgi:hypothetical protein
MPTLAIPNGSKIASGKQCYQKLTWWPPRARQRCGTRRDLWQPATTGSPNSWPQKAASSTVRRASLKQLVLLEKARMLHFV